MNLEDLLEQADSSPAQRPEEVQVRVKLIGDLATSAEWITASVRYLDINDGQLVLVCAQVPDA